MTRTFAQEPKQPTKTPTPTKNIQRKAPNFDEEELLDAIQYKSDQNQSADASLPDAIQRRLENAFDSEENTPAQRMEAASPNKTGLPDNLKAGIENLSGMSMDDVRVHYNSPQPAQLQALAYTQGTNIHVGPGQEQYLAHEAWHVVQQKEGRVRPTLQMAGQPVNDQQSLEHEADVMGARALRATAQLRAREPVGNQTLRSGGVSEPGIIQGQWWRNFMKLTWPAKKKFIQYMKQPNLIPKED